MRTKLIQDEKGLILFFQERRIILGSWPTTNISILVPEALESMVKACLNSTIAFSMFKQFCFYIEF